MQWEKEISQARRDAGLSRIAATGRVDPETLEERLAEIPHDTRTFQQRLFGDPVFERSALYQKQMNGS